MDIFILSDNLMKKFLLIFFLFLFSNFESQNSFAQINLVPNPSFEQYSSCPSSLNQVYLASPWFNPTQGTSDYFNACFTNTGFSADVPSNWIGYQNARTGDAYTGIAVYPVQNPPDYREYVEVRLKDSLQAGVNYYVSFYVSLADSVNYAADSIGAYFSSDSILSSNSINFPYNPQVSNGSDNIISDKQNWMKVSGQFTAQGGEKFMTIGNFKDDSQTNKILVSGGGNPDNYKTVIFYYIDDVCVSTNPDTCNVTVGVFSINHADNVYFYPNPAKNYITVKTPETGAIINIHDTRGNIVKKIFKIETEVTFYLNDLTEGLYFLQIITSQKTTFQKIIITK